MSKRSQINFSSPLFTPFFITLVQKVSNYFFSSPKSVVYRRSQWCAIAFGLGGVGRGASVTSGLRNDSRLFEWPRTARGKVRAEAYSKTRLLSWGDVVKNVPKPVCYTFDLWEEGRGVSATPGLQNDSRLFEGPRVACRKVHLEARSKT